MTYVIGPNAAQDNHWFGGGGGMRFRVRGVDRVSGRAVKPLVVEAPDERSALSAAAGAGMLVEGVEALPPPPPPPPPMPVAPTNKYPAMAVLAGWYRFLAVVCGIAAVAGVIAGLAAVEKNTGLGLALIAGSVVWGALAVVSLVALAEGIGLMTDIEATLRQIRDRLPRSPAGQGDREGTDAELGAAADGGAGLLSQGRSFSSPRRR
jgi:hypothetical protein